MAELNPQMQGQEGNFLGYSRGSEADTSWSGLFQDAAQGVQTGTRVTNELIVEDIRKNVTQGVDEIRDIFLSQYKDRVNNLTQAYRSGQIRDSYYWNTLDVEARRIRSRYPGHRREVDTIMQEVAGANPANRLMAELSQESAQRGGTRDREEQRLDHWLKEGTQIGAPSAVHYQRLASEGRAPTWQQLQAEVAERQAIRAERDNRTQSLSLRRAEGQNVSEESSRNFERDMNVELGLFYNTATGAIPELDRRIQNLLRSPTAANPQMISQLSTFFQQQIRGPMLQTFDTALNRQIEGRPQGESYATLINDPNRIKALRDAFTSRVDALGQAINDKDWGAVARLNQALKAYGDSNALRLMEDAEHGQTFRYMDGMRQVMGPQFYNLSSVLREADRIIPAAREAFFRGQERAFNDGSGVIENLAQDARLIQDRGRRGQVANARINATMNDLANSQINEESLTRLATTMFGPRNQNFFSNPQVPIDNVAQVYNRITGDIRVHQNMQRIRTTNPDLYENYSRWVVEGFAQVNRRIAQNIQTDVVDVAGSPSHIVFNPMTSQFHHVDPQRKNSETTTAVRQLNQSISGMISFLTAEGRSDDEVRGLVSQYLNSLPVNPNHAPGRTFWGNVRDALHNTARALPVGAEIDVAGPLANWPVYAEGSRNVVTNPEIYSTNSQYYSPLLNLIGRGESDSIGGYTAIYGRRPDPGLTDMTLTQIMALQEDMVRNGSPSSAIGRFQFTRDTLRETISALGLNPSAVKFTPEVQNQLATRLLSEAGLERYLANPTQGLEDRIIHNLAGRWAALQTVSGVGRYDNDGLNRATIKPDEVRKILKELAKQYGRQTR